MSSASPIICEALHISGVKRSPDASDEPPLKRVKRILKEGFLQRTCDVGPIHAADWAEQQLLMGVFA